MTPHRSTCFLVVAALALAGCGGTLRALPPASELEGHAAEDLSNYQIGATDVLRVSIWRQPELSVDAVVVRLDGKISVPLLDDVQAAGLTPLELKQVLTERYAEYISNPTVTVIVSGINSKLVYVIGEVPRPGPMPIRGDFRVVDALSTAGGFTPFAGKSNVKIIRSANGSGPVEFRFDYDRFVQGEDIEQNILLVPGDKIVVPEEAPFWKTGFFGRLLGE
jgi:polysaccharide export outer membrane protein